MRYVKMCFDVRSATPENRAKLYKLLDNYSLGGPHVNPATWITCAIVREDLLEIVDIPDGCTVLQNF